MATAATQTTQVLMQIASDLWFSFLAFVPNLVGATVLLAVGYVIGRALGRVTLELLHRAGLDEELKKDAHIQLPLSHYLEVIVRWVIYLVFIQATANVLGIPSLSAFVDRIITILPQVVGAGLVILVAYAVGIYFKEEVLTRETFYANVTGKIIFFLVLYLGLSVALRVVDIPLLIVDQILLILVGSVGLGIALALGLGLKDAVSDMGKVYAKEYKKMRKKKD